jgi:hypothetical protein
LHFIIRKFNRLFTAKLNRAHRKNDVSTEYSSSFPFLKKERLNGRAAVKPIAISTTIR